MSNSNKTARSNNKMRALNIGRVAILIAGFYFFKDLSKDSHFVLALVSSVVWLLCFYFYRKIPNKTGESASLPIASILFVVLEVVIAVILKTDVSLRAWFTLWVIPMNIMGGMLGFMSLFSALFFNIHPDIFLSAYPPPPPDPIATLPDPIQEIINEGRRRTGNITLTSMIIFAGVGILVPFIFTKAPNTYLLIMGIICVTGFITVPILRHITARKWQEEALESGIRKDTLEEAAKLGGIPWPKIKEE